MERDARLRATGPRSETSGTNDLIALLRSEPRPASASPKPIVEAVTPTRVAGVNIESTWSKSTSLLVWLIGTTALLGYPRRSWPRVICRYLSPIAPLSRMSKRESTGNGLTFWYR